MTDLVIHPAARDEYVSAAEWYAERSLATAERFVTEVQAAIEAIRKRPDSFALVDDQHRMYLVNKFPYYIAYRYRSGLVEVVAIRHAARDQDAWKDR
jgi:plasmid stabilization system protein ParE